MVQWVKNPTTVAHVTAEEQAESQAWCSGLKDLGLAQALLRFNPWPGNFHMPGMATFKKKKKMERVEGGRYNMKSFPKEVKS